MGVMERYNEKRKKNEEGTASPSSKGVFERSKLNRYYSTFDTSGVNEDYINSFLSDANNFFSGAEKTYNGVGWGNASSIYDSTNSTWQSLQKRKDTINAWLYKNQSRLNEESYKSLTNTLDSIGNSAKSIVGAFENSAKFFSQFETEDSYNQWKANEDWKKEFMGKEDFQEKSQYQSTVNYYNTLRMEKPKIGDALYEYVNNQKIKEEYAFETTEEDARSKIKSEGLAYSLDTKGDGETTYEEKGYDYLTDDEIKIFNYYYATEGKKKAQEYLDSLEQILQNREAIKIYENIDSNFQRYVFGVVAGVEQFRSGLEGVGNAILGNEQIVTDATQIVSGMVREDLADDGFKIFGNSIGQMGYDLINTTSNMLPSIIVGMATGGVGGVLTLGASAAGNGYNEMISLGYDKNQARAYGLLVGAAEAGLSYVLGGISALGGKGSGGLTNFVANKVDNALARVAIKIGGNMLSEGLEESIQTVLEPWFKSIATGVDFEAPNIDEILYSGLLGALSAGLLEGAGTVSGEVNTYKAGKQVQNAGAVDRLTKLGSTFSADSVAYKLAGKVNENTGAYTVGRLLNEVGGTLTEQNMSEIVKSLTRKGYSNKDAKITAKWLNEVVEGTELTEQQIEIIENNDVVSKTFYDVIVNQNSTVNQRLQGYNDAIDMIRNGGKPNAETAQNNTNAPQTGIPSAESGTAQIDGNVETETGKNILVDTGEEVSVKEISSIKDGAVTVRLEDGREVNARDIDFGNEREGLVYEAVADMNEDTARDLIEGFNNGDFGEGRTLSLESYLRGFNEAYRYGSVGMPVSEMSRSGFSADLSEQQKKIAYNRGKADSIAKVKAQQARVDSAKNAQTTKNATENTAKKKGKVYFDKSKKALNERQKASVKSLEVVAEALGVDIHLFESMKDENGKRIGANGWYDPSDNSIHIDLYAGASGEGTMLFTASHELTHFIREWSPAKFKVFADFLLEQYGAKDISVEELVQRQIAKAKNNGRDIDFDTAYEEVIADSCEAMLTDSNAIEKLAMLKAKDKGLFNKIKRFINKLVAKIKAVYAKLNPDSVEGNYVRKMVDVAEQLQALWVDALVDAGEAYQTIGSRDLSKLSDAKTVDGEALFQYRAMESDKDIYRAMLVKHGLMTNVEIDNMFAMIDNALDVIKNNLEALDYAWDVDIDDRAFMPVKPNSDSLYKVSLDFSTLCRKRLLQQTIQATLQEALNKPLSKEEGIAIRDELMKIQEEGRQIEIACALCYVESARMKSPTQIKKFLKNRTSVLIDFFAGRAGGSTKEKIKIAEADARAKLHKKNPNGISGKNGTTVEPLTSSLNKMAKQYADQIRDAKKAAKLAYKPTPNEQRMIDAVKSMKTSDFTSPEGLENLAKNYSDIFDAYTSFVRNATHSKGIEKDTWWRAGDSDALIGQDLIDKMNAENGLRSQSWSDFQVIHLLDYIAATIELSTKNAKRQSYTKVPDYVLLLGRTGDMINMSLIPMAKYNGNLEYDSVEGIDYKVALELRDKFHATAGTICIGIDNAQIRQLLADGTIDYVIPYHKSSMSQATKKLMHIPSWFDYEPYQSESKLSPTEAKANAKKYGVELLNKNDKKYNKSPNFSEWFDIQEVRQIAKMENANPSDPAMKKKYGVMYGAYKAMQNAANNYLKLCAERGLTPKFSHEKADFTSEENYWKLLIDRKMVDNVTGEIIEQQAIKPIFDEADVLGILNRELERYPQVKKDQEYATRKVVGKFLSGEMKVDKDTREAIKKTVDNVTAVNIEASSKDLKLSDRETSWRDVEKIQGLEDYSVEEVTDIVRSHIENLAMDFGEEISIIDIRPYGSRARGTAKNSSDLDVVVQYEGDIREDDMFNMLNDEDKLVIDGIEVDINPIKAEDTGTIEEYLDRVYSYDKYSDIRYSEREVATLTDEDYSNVEKHFGITKNYDVAGYMLTNGKMLDFSGKHWGDDYSTFRQVDHRDIQEVLDDRGTNGVAAMIDMIGNGNIRLMPETGGINLAVMPNESQINQLRGYINHFRGEVIIDVDAVGGDTIHSWEYNKGTSSAKILSDIKEYFEKGTIPQQQSSLNQFRYSDRDSAGNTLSEEQQEFFKDSKVRDNKGRLQVVYHGTTSDFNTFKRGDIGYHFGSYTQARNRLSYQGGKKRYIKAYLDIKNPLVIEHDSGSWHGNYAAGMLLTWGDFNGNLESVERLQEIANMYDTRKSDAELKNFLKSLGYDGIQYLNTHESDFGKESYSYIAFDSNQIKLVENKAPTYDPDIRYSTRDLAPTFYSQMGKVVEGMKQDKFGASSIVPMLRGRGVKAEEIRWSGIVTWLEGKKSVTKQELLEFIAGSQLQIGEQMSGDDIDLRYNAGSRSYTLYDKSGNTIDTYTYNEFIGGYVSELNEEIYSDANELEDAVREEYGNQSAPRWSQYKLDGGTNYRELVFTLPNSTYSNRAMRGHWGQDAEGVLVHARIQDFDVNGKKMLFVEELQSDWHNEGHEKGYTNKEYEDAVESHDKLYNEYKKLDLAFHKYVRSNEFMTDPEDVRKKKHDWLRRKAETAQKKYLDAEKVVNSLKEKGAGDTPDAPFKDTYHEYVLKRLLRMAAEQGYDSIGWTPADIQVKRWSEDYAEAYRIEYDQDIPKFLKKYGRQWGAKVDHSYLNKKETLDDISFDDIQNKSLEEINNGTKVWSMDITDSMKDSVLHEGQVLYSERYANAEENSDILALVEKVKSGKFNGNEKVYLGSVTEEIANELLSEAKVDVRGFKVAIEARQIHHILKDHGENGLSDHSMANPSDIAKMEYAINNHDDISEAGQTQAYKQIVNGKTRAAKTVLYETRIGKKSYYVVQAVPDTKAKTLYIVTAFIGKSGYKKEASQIINAKNLDVTAKTESANASDKSQDMSVSLGVQFSNAVTSPNSNTIIRKSKAFVNKNSNISENSQKLSDRDPDSVSNRSLLANALETAAQNDIEKNKLAQYKQKIALIESEEVKLHELREQIKELSFARGRRDTEKLRSLQFEANQTASRINTYDRQLLNLEASKPLKDVLEREKALAYKKAEQKGKEALAAYREKTAKTTRELMTRYQESRAKATEGRHKTELRNKIKKVVGDLNQLLLRPTKDKHVKEELKNAVAEALSAINMDTIGADERVAKYNDLIAKTSDPDMIAELTKTRDRIELQGDNLKDKLNALQSAYEKVKNSTDPELKNAYQEPVMNAIKSVCEQVGNTPLRDMTLTQLEAVYEMYTMVLHTVRTANKAFKAKKGETITQISEAVNDEIRKISKEKFTRNPIIAGLRKVGWTLLKPFTAFRTIGSDTFTGLYTELRNGEDVYYVDVNEAKNFIQNQYKKHNFESWDTKQTKTFTAKSGKEFTLTLEQMMSLYAYSRRYQAHAHIIEGGIVLENAEIKKKTKLGLRVKQKVDTKTAFNISEETLDDICNSLTGEQKAYVEDMQAYLSDAMGAKGNEVSMELLGVKLFKEKFYFPLKSSKYYMGFNAEEAGEIKLKNPAFSKETVHHANNPVVLQDFTDVWATHVNDMSMYHAFVLPLEDFTRVYNYKTKTAENVETMSTEATIANAFGEGATQYIRNFLKSLNGGVRTESVGIADKAVSLSKKGAVLGSASVMIQQPSAIMRAMALINPIHFVASTHKSLNLVKHNRDWAELKQYAPIAGIKEMGRFDVGMGQSTVKWIKDQNTIMEKADDILSKAPAFMDEVTWVGIWNAVKNEVKHKNKDLAVNSDEYFKKCGERFTEVISLTQVYDSVFSRSDIMRNQSWIAKALTSFMAEPSTTLNMLVDSFIQGKRTGKVGGFVKVTTGTTGAIIGSIVLNAALKSIITAMRDDDEDESYAEKYLGAFVGNAKDDINPLSYIPFVKDIVSIFEGYDVERMDMALFSDLKNAIDALDSDSKTEYEKWSGLIGAISAFVGIPFKNVERDIRGAYNTIKSFSEGEKTTDAGINIAIKEAWTGETISNKQQLYEAIINGDKSQIDRVKGRFEDQDAIDSAIRSALRENDSRIKEAAQARYDGDIAEYKRIAKEIIAEGYFSQDIVVGAINSEISAIKREEEEKNKPNATTEDSSTTEEDEVTSIYSGNDLNTAFDNGDTDMAREIIQDLINTKVANGKTEKEAKSSLRSSMTSYWKPLYKQAYKNGDAEEMRRIREILYASELYGNANEVVKTVQNWIKDD